ncbi:hypothetical protein Rsub_06034 [Raphidocelis subcapitata]|uniref:Cyclin N-terminal domain-containing protein n=1 Tax=Raphidocelis subcapitata TaxID=307507 RepID=A0A2V0P324_9CHLO|nr:hypothetical protein Rsub_06034 [Raphidocelis subcapitata]|eukprot:GBF93302.1 hypothetical protein Rsub_06034 [Raphidocelis subcapitata]
MQGQTIARMVFFPQKQLEDSPSRADGMGADEERAMRRAAQQIIIDVCQTMHMHVQYAYVAVYLCYRYYAVRSWKRSDRWLIMPAALSLALKMRESPKPIGHIIVEFEKRRWRDYDRSRPPADRKILDKAYLDGLREPFCLAERAILFAVGFEFGIGDPYPHVAKQLFALGLTDSEHAAKVEVQQMAWNFLRDSLSTTVCLRHPPEKIAATAVFLSFQVYRRPLALSAAAGEGAEEGEALDAPKSFCEVCNIMPQEVIEIANEITATYVASLRHQPAPQLAPVPAGSSRRPVALPAIESVVKGDRWTLVSKGSGGSNGAAAGDGGGRGGGSRSGGDDDGSLSASGRLGAGAGAGRWSQAGAERWGHAGGGSGGASGSGWAAGSGGGGRGGGGQGGGWGVEMPRSDDSSGSAIAFGPKRQRVGAEWGAGDGPSARGPNSPRA